MDSLKKVLKDVLEFDNFQGFSSKILDYQCMNGADYTMINLDIEANDHKKNLKYNDSIAFELPLFVGNSTKILENLRTSIIIGKQDLAIKFYHKKNEYIDISFRDLDIRWTLGSSITINKVSYSDYNLIKDSKYYNQLPYTNGSDLKPISKNDLTHIKLTNRMINRLSLLIKRPIDSSCFLDNIDHILEVVVYDLNIDLPIDFKYLSGLDGIFEQIALDSYSIRLEMLYRYRRYSKISETLITKSIDKFLNMQTKDIMIMQTSSDSSILSLKSQSEKIYLTDYKHQKLPIYNSRFLGVIDPIATSEGNNINLKNHITTSLVIKNTRPYIKVLNKEFNEIELDYIIFTTSKILCEDCVDYEHKSIHPIIVKNKECFQYLQYGEFKESIVDDFDYILQENGLFCTISSLIPFLDRSNPTRSLLAIHMMGDQSIPIIGGEESPVQTKTFSTLNDSNPLNIVSYYDGIVSNITSNSVFITTSYGIKEVSIPREYYTINHTQLHYHPVVEVGSIVTKGMIIIEINSFKNGVLNMGVPTKILYSAERGGDWQDSIVVSESFAKKMGHEVIEKLRIPYSNGGIDFIPWSNITENLKLLRSKNENFNELGFFKIGSYVDYNQTIHVQGYEVSSLTGFNIDKLSKTKTKYLYTKSMNRGEIIGVDLLISSKNVFKGEVITPLRKKNLWSKGNWEIFQGYHKFINDQFKLDGSHKKWEVSKNIIDDPQVDFALVFRIKTINELKLGDKVTTSYSGSKGVIGLILPDSAMPSDEEGSFDMILSALGTMARKNPSQFFEARLSKIAKRGREKVLEWESNKLSNEEVSFYLNAIYRTSKLWSNDEIRALLNRNPNYLIIVVRPLDKKYTHEVLLEIESLLGLPLNGVSRVIDGVTGRPREYFERSGIIQTSRLHFIVENKAKASSSFAKITGTNKIPLVLGEGFNKEGGQKLDELSIMALLAHGQGELLFNMLDNDKKSLMANQTFLALGLQIDI